MSAGEEEPKGLGADSPVSQTLLVREELGDAKFSSVNPCCKLCTHHQVGEGEMRKHR